MSIKKIILFTCLLICLISTSYFCAESAIAQNTYDLSAPGFSTQSGFYENPFHLEISSEEPDAVILYTLDGSEPNPDHIGGAHYSLQTELNGEFSNRTMTTFVYDSPLPVTDRSHDENQVSAIPNHYYLFAEPASLLPKGTVVRAAIWKDGNISEISTATFFVGEYFGDYLHLPVLSIIVQEDGFWGYEHGIYVPGRTFDPNQEPVNYDNGNYYQRGDEWERPVHIEYFEPDGSPGFSQQAGIRIHGGTSRWFVNRSFRLYARSDYGQSTIDYPLFPNRGPQVHKRLKLRTAGQDYEHTYLRDALMSLLMIDTEVTVEDYHPVNLFINGEYWGISNMRERFDDHYVERNFGVPREDVEILSESANQHYLEFLNYANNTPRDEEEYFDVINRYIDLDNFLDLKIAEIFFGRWDMHWEHWRDGRSDNNRWRWVMWDFDVAMVLPGYSPTLRNDWTGSADYNVSTNYLKPFLTDYRTNGLNREFSIMMQNQDVRNRFLNRLALMMSSNLSDERMLAEIDRLQQDIAHTMPRHIERWAEIERGIKTMNEWNASVDILRAFSAERQAHVYNHATDFFGLSGTSVLHVEIAGGNGIIRVDGRDTRALNQQRGKQQSGSWQGRLFNEIPVTLTAAPDAGYRFDSWSGDVSSSEDSITVILTSDFQILANFSRIEEAVGDEMNPHPHVLKDSDFTFDYWSPEEPEGNFPEHMVFLQSSVNDPGLETEMTHPYFIPFEDENNNDYNEDDYDKFGYPYKLTRQTRINALEERGISMINTGRGRDLGAVVLAVDTRDVSNATISWTAQTLQANSRVYHIRFQYRIGFLENWKNVTDSDGNIIEFARSDLEDEVHFQKIPLPTDATEQPYIQLRWKYYFTGTRISEESGQRDELRIDNILVKVSENVNGTPVPPDDEPFEIKNFPNPFRDVTTIQFHLPEPARVTIEIYSIHGRHVQYDDLGTLPGGNHHYEFRASGLSSGTYFYRIRTLHVNEIRKMMIIR